ncbi:hypothetical protein XELAEV_18017375mg [Xenopus laevis]|uniref:Uncharacterized protein n=1 Tax=Xenopus laevis TaxID=8355 RepID=A0A974HSN1_XENLA|nr:hypothetical protein XELAEV_18017375mg [Xenopus laevis]
MCFLVWVMYTFIYCTMLKNILLVYKYLLIVLLIILTSFPAYCKLPGYKMVKIKQELKERMDINKTILTFSSVYIRV